MSHFRSRAKSPDEKTRIASECQHVNGAVAVLIVSNNLYVNAILSQHRRGF